MESGVKIFYSWQTDLPSSNNRSLIQEAIESSVKYLQGTVTVIPDRDTMGTTGSPNIEDTIFKKIDDCDLFIADVSFVNTYKNKAEKEKCTPNANVLIELGYAVKVLGWENIICFFNQDYGNEEDLPFDLNHHRVTGYSIEKSNKAKVKENLRGIIVTTIISLLERGLRPKAGFASCVVGAYDESSKKVISELHAHRISDSDYVINKVKNKWDEVKNKIVQVNKLPLPEILEKYEGKDPVEIAMDQIINYDSVIINEYEKKSIIKTADKFGIDIGENFFELGGLEVCEDFVSLGVKRFRGSSEAKNKYFAIKEIITLISRVTMYELYLHTFDEMLFFPLAIWNNSFVTDKDISITVSVDEKSAEVVIPDETMIYEPAKELVGEIYKSGIIKILFHIPDTADIKDGSDSFPTIPAEIRHPVNLGMMTDPLGHSKEPSYGMDDYVDEIQRYIAEPIEGSKNCFDFHISKLQPNEKNWLGRGILVKPNANEVTVHYNIHSDRTRGDIQGELKYKIR